MNSLAWNRREFLISAAAACIAVSLKSPAWAQAYPTGPIVMVIPFAAGGGTDASARILATGMSKILGQQVVPENRPGAGGVTGAAHAALADADGYTLLFGGLSSLVIGPVFYDKIAYDPITSFQPIGRAMGHPLLLAVHSSVPVKSVEELVAYAKENPGKLNYASSGVGSLHHLTGELFKSEAGIDMLHIPYQGNGPAVTDLMAGVVQVMFAGVPQMLPYREDANMRFLAVTSDSAISTFPKLPSMSSLGFQKFDIAQSTYGVLAPAGIPKEMVTTLVDVLHEAVKVPEVAEAIVNSGMEAIIDEPEAYREWIKVSKEIWADVAEKASIQLKQ